MVVYHFVITNMAHGCWLLVLGQLTAKSQELTAKKSPTVWLSSEDLVMEWTKDAENAVKKVPFFVRKKVRARVETQVAETGKRIVTLTDVRTAQKRHLQNMSKEIKGYQIDTCFGPGGCPNRTVPSEQLLERIEKMVVAEDLLSFLKQHVQGDLKYHHEFRITLAECPNACSQPQIKDIGIIGALVPVVTNEACTACEACIEACPDNCIHLNSITEKPEIDMDRCMSCGKCVKVCPTQTIQEEKQGFRVQIGGKLGRHPQLARELPGVYREEKILEIIHYCISLYKRNSRHGERFAQIFKDSDFDLLVNKLGEHTMEKTTFTIPNISCGHCVMSIKNELSDLDGVSAADGDPDMKSMTVTWEAPATLEIIKTHLKEINYPAA